jgi:predicted PurR-regulated permease PerM
MSIILWSAVLVIIFYPLYKKILSKLKKQSISSILSIIIILICFILPLGLITGAIVNEAAGLATSTYDKVTAIINDPARGQKFTDIYNYVNQYVNIQKFVNSDELKGFLTKVSAAVLQATFDFLGGAAGTMVSLFFAIFTMYYLFRDGDKILKKLPDVIPLEKDQTGILLQKIYNSINATIYGSLFIALIQGTMGGLMLWILGVPSPIIFGVLMMILAILPMGGTGFVWVPIVIVFVITGDYAKAVILAAYGLLAIGMIDNFLMPKIVGKRTKMHELFIFFSVLGGIQLFGLLGLFLGPVVLSITMGLLSIFREGELN